MKVLVSDRFVVNSVVSLACDVLMNVVVSGTDTSCADDGLKHVNIGDHVASMKCGDVIVFVASCEVTEPVSGICNQKSI